MSGQYTITVTFTRELGDDAEIATERYPNLPVAEALVRQFIDELQEAYNAGTIGGHFQVHDRKVALDDDTLEVA